MSDNISFNALKERATLWGTALGRKINNAGWSAPARQAVIGALPQMPLKILLVNEDLAAVILAEIKNLQEQKSGGSFDESTVELVVRDALLKGILANSARGSVGDGDSDTNFSEDILRSLAPEKAGGSLEEILQNLLANLPEVEETSADNVRENFLPEELAQEEKLLNPPMHFWSGSQPGQPEQFDSARRYHFSPETGWLERVVVYSGEQPAWQIHYAIVQKNGSVRPQPQRVDFWKNNIWQVHTADGLGSWQVMRGIDGREQAAPLTEKNVFILPDGSVVRLLHLGSWWHKPQAEMLGRLKNFRPSQPFTLITSSGSEAISPTRFDVVIDGNWRAYEINHHGLRLLGKAEPPSTETAEEEILPEIMAGHVIVSRQPDWDIKVKHPLAFSLLQKKLPTVAGHHLFVQSHLPEMIDLKGGRVAEETLRVLEALAMQLGLLRHAYHREDLGEGERLVLLKAIMHTEEKLWDAINGLEKILDTETGGAVDRAALRAWLDEARHDPDTALFKLVK